MALETIGTHLAGIRHTEAATGELESATRAREALLPGRVESLDLSNEQAQLMLSELYKNAELAKWARDNQIHKAQALNHYFTNNKEDLIANVAIREKKEAYGNRFDLATKEADMIYLNLDPLLTELTNIMNSPELTPEQGNEAMGRINQIYDGHIQRWIQEGILDDDDRQEDGIIRPEGGLPGGISQGDPLTRQSFGALGFTVRVAKRMSEIGREEQAKLAGKAPTVKDALQTQQEFLKTGEAKSQQIQELLWGAFPETAEGLESGKQASKGDWESANFELTRVLEGATTETGDPMNEAQALTQWARQSLEPGTIDFDQGGTILDGTINTYLPTAQLGEFTVQNMYDPGTTTLNRDTYINMLKERIKGMSEEEAQRTANLMFTNMVTSLLLRK